MRYEEKRAIHHALQNYFQPLSYLGTAYYLGRQYAKMPPFLINGGVTAAGIFAARKLGASCIIGKIAVISMTRFALSLVFKKFKNQITPLNKNERNTLSFFQVITALIFSGMDEYYHTMTRNSN
ncbi:MAG: hypothetical protein H7A41_02115 [Chlamydiales bacterium]|nr:hypothetical protein [Chlamydiales bacterium]